MLFQGQNNVLNVLQVHEILRSALYLIKGIKRLFRDQIIHRVEVTVIFFVDKSLRFMVSNFQI